jgi:hypothetical protein
MWYKIAKPKLKIIFLDFDGVLNDDPKLNALKHEQEFKLEHLSKHIHEDKISLVNKITEETGAKVIVSSSWRLLADLKTLKSLLKDKGLEAEVIDTTAKGGKEHDDRWKHIEQKIKEYNPTSYVILDDDHISTDKDFKNPNFVKTKDKLGITENNVDRAIKILNKDK